MIIMGIDPGLRFSAYGVISHQSSSIQFMHCGTIAAPTKETMPQRLAYIFKHLQEKIALYEPVLAVVEESFVSANAQSSLKLGQARAMALLAPALAHIDVIELAPRDIKKSVTGSGKADKHQMQTIIKMLLPKMTAQNDHEADALAMAIAGANYYATQQQIAKSL